MKTRWQERGAMRMEVPMNAVPQRTQIIMLKEPKSVHVSSLTFYIAGSVRKHRVSFVILVLQFNTGIVVIRVGLVYDHVFIKGSLLLVG